MALLTLPLMHQLSQTGELLFYKEEHYERTEYGTYRTTKVEFKGKAEIKADYLKNLLNPDAVRLQKRLGGVEHWQYRFANNGIVEVVGFSISPKQDKKVERRLTIRWGNKNGEE